MESTLETLRIRWEEVSGGEQYMDTDSDHSSEDEDDCKWTRNIGIDDSIFDEIVAGILTTDYPV